MSRSIYYLVLAGVFVITSFINSSRLDSTIKPNGLAISFNQGQNWKDITNGLPGDIQASAIISLKSNFYLGTNKGLYRTNYIFPNVNWNSVNGAEKAITGLYLNSDKLVCTTTWYGLNEYSPETGILFQKTKNSPSEVVNSFVKVSETCFYYGSDYGLFRSTNAGQVWEKVLNKGRVSDIVKSGNKLIISGSFGILSMDLLDSKWEQSLWPDCYISQLIDTDKELLAIGFYENKYMKIPNVVFQSLDQGKSWNKLEMPLNLGSVNQILKTKEYYFVSSKEGIFRSTNLKGTWEKIHIGSTSPFGYYKLFHCENYLFSLYIEPGC